MKPLICRTLLLIYCLIFTALFSLADPPGPPPPGNNPPGGTPVGAPINDGLLILLMLGIGYGLYKLYEMHQEAKEKNQQTI
jgi:hypothetical protein